MKNKFLSIIILLAVSLACYGVNNKNGAKAKPALMWFDAEANFARLSNPDSIDFYLTKIKYSRIYSRYSRYSANYR